MDLEIEEDQIQVLALLVHDVEKLTYYSHTRAELANAIPPTNSV